MSWPSPCPNKLVTLFLKAAATLSVSQLSGACDTHLIDFHQHKQHKNYSTILFVFSICTAWVHETHRAKSDPKGKWPYMQLPAEHFNHDLSALPWQEVILTSFTRGTGAHSGGLLVPTLRTNQWKANTWSTRSCLFWETPPFTLKTLWI